MPRINLITSFSADQTQYTHLSTSLAALTAHGTSVLEAGNALDFTGTSSGLNVFDVTGATEVIFQKGSVNETGISAASVLYNIASNSVDLAGGKDPMGLMAFSRLASPATSRGV